MAEQVSKAVKAAIQAIENRQGRLDPQSVVAAARNKKSPLHKQFEWDDTKAAEKYRLEQARELIRLVRVEVVLGGVNTLSPMYIRDPRQPPETAGYQRLTKVRKQDIAEVVAKELDYIASLLTRLRGIVEQRRADAPQNLLSEIDALWLGITRLKEMAA